MGREKRYFRVFLKGGSSHKYYEDWLNSMSEQGAATVDFASHNLRVVQTFKTEDELLFSCSRSKRRRSFADDVEIREINRESADNAEDVASFRAIQRCFHDFTDVA